jgi:uncharacterized protein
VFQKLVPKGKIHSMAAQISFYGSLNFFLGPGPNPRVLPIAPHARQLKDTIESYGVPHCEVDQVLINGIPCAFQERLKRGDSIEVFPVDEEPNADLPSRVRPPPLDVPKFVVDCNLGKLNSLMRALGFDCYYENDIPDNKAVEVAVRDQRILLTKDVRLLMRAVLTYGYCVRSTWPANQIREVITRYQLWPQARLLSRCIDCNLETVEVPKEDVWDRLEPLTKRYYDRFFICPNCNKIFWRGSHFKKIREWHDQLGQEFSNQST